MPKKEEIALFPVTDKDLRLEYTELGEVEEFRQLTQKQMTFVWLFANKTSPYSSVPISERVLKCLHVLKDELTGTTIEEYSLLIFPPNISAAIDRMKKFNPFIRTQAKSLTEIIFKNIKKIVNVNMDELVEMEDKKKYVDIAMGVAKNMPELIRQLENGYGVRETKSAKEEKKKDTQTMWDKVMSEDDET